jgi:SAM-dependent methyltransferase
MLLELLPREGRGLRVLDVGCANGYLGEALAERGYEVTGIEKPGLASDTFPRSVELIEADIDYGVPTLGLFDYVLCADVLEHLHDPPAVLRDLRGMLKPGGRLLVSLPNSGHLYFRLKILSGDFPKHDKGLFDRTHLHFCTWRGWATLLASSRYRIESVRSTATPFGLAFPRWADTAAIRLLESFSYALARFWKTLFAYQFLVVASVFEEDRRS